MRTAAITMMLANNSHETVNSGKAIRRDRTSVGRSGGGRGTLKLFMSSLIVSFSVVSMTAAGAATRAFWVVALALIALALIDRMKPSTPRRAVVRVDNKPTRLYQEPNQQQRRRAITNLSAGAIILGALIACIVAFFFTIVLEVVGGLLRA
jgi:hypothetical protein